ncbi:hypothetical protein CYMTET_53008 [Cymbomonas tetramitiformis]|uniref:SRCR domain-containing protein n=1 Tax=Cymbomonas tetramitiformis TaxID=36881 RepID=A0AAE0BJ13_9CHLO|nr:hypothetical protein CYMTET_53008 [Cymbomonas tetramitiformis]
MTTTMAFVTLCNTFYDWVPQKKPHRTEKKSVKQEQLTFPKSSLLTTNLKVLQKGKQRPPENCQQDDTLRTTKCPTHTKLSFKLLRATLRVLLLMLPKLTLQTVEGYYICEDTCGYARNNWCSDDNYYCTYGTDCYDCGSRYNYAGVTSVRLVGGYTTNSGRVEVLVNGRWGTICDDDFDISDGHVVCRQLGYTGATSVYWSAYFGMGSGPIWLDSGLSCSGYESELNSCYSFTHTFGPNDCGHSEDAGVSCDNASPPPIQYPRPSPPPPESGGGAGDSGEQAIGIGVGVSVAALVCIGIIGAVVFYRWRKKPDTRAGAQMGTLPPQIGAPESMQTGQLQPSTHDTDIPTAFPPNNSNNSDVITLGTAPQKFLLDEPDAQEKRAMLVAFYKKHNPGQVAQVDDIMGAYTADAIQESCLRRYDDDPFKPPPMAAMEPDAQAKRAILVAFYKKHNPGQVAQVDDIMASSTITDIQESCKRRYHDDPFKPPPMAATERDAQEKRAMLVAFYKKHNPGQVAQVDDIMSSYTADAIKETCLSRYNIDPFKPPHPFQPPPMAAMEPDAQEKRAMLVAFYKKHNCQMAQVDDIMGAYTADAIQESCLSRYNIDPFKPPPMAAMEPDAQEKRAMLVAFYKKHNPGQMAQVDDIMGAYTADAIQESCLNRYNIDPFKPPPMAAMEPDAQEKRAMLVAFYKKHNPGQMAQVDDIMGAYTADAIQESCLSRYSIDPFKPPPMAAMEPDAQEKRAMLVAFYKKHNPGQMAQVDDIMGSYTADAIQESCLSRYDIDPFKPPPMAAMEPDAQEKRAMLVAFYKKHNPGQMAQVDDIMGAYTADAIQETCLSRYSIDPFKPPPTNVLPEI